MDCLTRIVNSPSERRTITTTETLIWIRVGDAADYQAFDGLEEVVDYLKELGVGPVDHWRAGGVDTLNYWGRNYISLYHGDTDANLVSNLLPDERVFVEDALRECYRLEQPT